MMCLLGELHVHMPVVHVLGMQMVCIQTNFPYTNLGLTLTFQCSLRPLPAMSAQPPYLLNANGRIMT
jgi:hypothetical protein